MDMLRSRDQFDMLVMQALARATTNLRDKEADELAVKIANAVGKMLGAKG